MHTDSKSTVYIQRQTTIHFETRLTEWEGDLLQFRQLKGRGTRHSVWEIWVKGDVYYTRHGRLDGKMQETSKRGLLKNKGKAHEISADQDALAMARRLARKKWDYEGYDQFIDGTNIDNRDTTMPVDRLLSSLPSSFSLYKPLNTMEGSKTMVKKAKAGKVRYVLKRNGLAFWIVVDGEGTLRMYSRRNRQHHKNEGPTELDNGLMDYETVIPWTTRFPHLLHAVHLLQLPPNTMMA